MTRREVTVSIEIARLTARLAYLEKQLAELRLDVWRRKQRARASAWSRALAAEKKAR